MHRRVIIRSGLLLFLVLCVSLSSARAHQIWSEGQAHQEMAVSRSAAQAVLQRARVAGLLPAQLASFAEMLSRLRRLTPPPLSPLWSPSRAGWFDRQTVKYRHLTNAIGRAVQVAALSEKSRTRADLDALRRAISTAQTLQVNAQVAQSVYGLDASPTRRCHTPRECRAIDETLIATTSSMQTGIQVRQRELAAIERAGSGTVSGIAILADAAVVPLQAGLHLMTYVSRRGTAEQAQLARLVAQAHAATTPQGVALAVAALRSSVATVLRDLRRALPAKMIVVSTEDQSASMYEGSHQVYSTPVTTGGPELPTDHGVFHIYFKASPFEFHSPWPPGSPYYYLPTPITFWMPFDGGQGLHDASWRSNFGPGSNVSPTDLGTGNTILGTHGCVNLPYDAAQWVWNWAPIGTMVVVV